jgi:hypothetical protein
MVIVRLSGTPSALVVLDPKLEVMSRLTMPLWFSTFAPLEPSPGNGAAGLFGELAVRCVAGLRTLPSATTTVGRACGAAAGRCGCLAGGRRVATGPECDQTGARKANTGNQLQQASPVQQPRQVVVQATIVVLQIRFTVVDTHHDQGLEPRSGSA